MSYYNRYADERDAHILYRTWSWFWRFYELNYLGGPDYHSPDIPISYVFPSLQTGEGGTEQYLHYDERQLKSFLWPDNREETGDYDQRVMRSVRLNLCRPIVDLYANHVFSKPIVREAKQATIMDTVWKDVNLRASTIDEWMVEGLIGAQVFGHMFAVVDLSHADAEVKTLADQLLVDVRPYATWFTPLQVVDWQVDGFGNFLWAKIVENDPSDLRQRPGTRVEAHRRFRVWYPDHWEIISDRSTDSKDAGVCAICGAEGVMEAGPNALGRVPVEVLYRKRVPGSAEPVGISMLTEIAAGDREVFNLVSRRQTLLYHQGVPLLAIPDPGRQLKRIELTVHRALPYNPTAGGGPPTYVAPPTDAVRVLDEQINGWLLQIRAMSGLSRGMGEQSIAARSGEALLVETNDKSAMLKALAHEAEDFEVRLAKMVAAYVGQDASETLVRYADRFDVSTLGDSIDEAQKFLGLSPVAKVRSEVMKAIQARLLSHLSPDTLGDLQILTEPTTQVAESAKGELITPSDLASVVTVNEARIQSGLTLLMLPDGSTDPDGALTVTAFRAKREAAVMIAPTNGASVAPLGS